MVDRCSSRDRGSQLFSSRGFRLDAAIADANSVRRSILPFFAAVAMLVCAGHNISIRAFRAAEYCPYASSNEPCGDVGSNAGQDVLEHDMSFFVPLASGEFGVQAFAHFSTQVVHMPISRPRVSIHAIPIHIWHSGEDRL